MQHYYQSVITKTLLPNEEQGFDSIHYPVRLHRLIVVVTLGTDSGGSNLDFHYSSTLQKEGHYICTRNRPEIHSCDFARENVASFDLAV